MESGTEMTRMYSPVPDPSKGLGFPVHEIEESKHAKVPMLLQDQTHAGYPTEAAHDIMERILEEWRDKFLEANADYGDSYESLGAAGQFGEIWRKVPKLKRSMWDGKPLNREQPREILMDLIGHCFLAIHLLDHGNDATPGATK